MPTASTRIRWLALIAFLITATVLFYLLAPYLNLESLSNHYLIIQDYKNQHWLLSTIIMMLAYILAVSFSIPGTAILTILTGFLFGIPAGLCMVLVSATTGATILFSLAKWFSADWIERKGSRWVARFQQGFQHNAWSYMLILRLLPIFPFPVINIVPGLLKIPTRVFMMSTLFGIIPGTLVYISLGNGLSQIFENNQQPNLGMIFEPHIILPLLGLALLALLPVLYQHFKGKKHD
jgi:uncharacterized membrane protein YdjX (TVP38/TMEM64 family)